MKYIECQSCGRLNIPDTEERCPQCGASLRELSVGGGSLSGERTAPVPNDTGNAEQPPRRKKAIIAAVIGLLVGIAFIIMGGRIVHDADITRFRESIFTGSVGHLREIEFGGDFYTEIYNGVEECEKDLAYIGFALVKLIKAVGVLICGIGASIATANLFRMLSGTSAAAKRTKK